MRFIQVVSTLALVVAALNAEVVSAKSSVGRSTGTIRQQALLSVQDKKREQLKQKTFGLSDAISQRGGSSDQKDAVTGAIILTLIERGVNKVFNVNGVKFPSQLGGCIILLGFLLLSDAISPGLGESIFASLSPGSALLAKWLPVFFVPGLAMLPLAPSVGSGLEVVKVLLVTGLGFVFSLSTVAFAVLFLRGNAGAVAKVTSTPVPKAAKGKAPAPVAKPFADDTMSLLLKISAASAAVSITATRMGNDLATPLRSIFLFFSTVASYVWSARLPSKFTKAVHPLITSTAVTLGVIGLTGVATGESFIDVLKTFKVGSLDLMKTGAGDVLLFLLGPAVVSFAIAMYSRRVLVKENFFIVVSAMLISSVGGLFGTAGFVKLIKLGGINGLLVRLSVLPRNVTTALAMAITVILEGDISIAASVVVLTGIIGATFARRLLDAMGIQDPVTRGLAVGAAAQGLGVSSMVPEPDAFPFAAMSMVLTAVSATILVSIPVVKETLIKIVS